MYGKNIFLTVISLISLVYANDYIISFQCISKNSELIYEKLNCSKAMTRKEGKKIFLFSLPVRSKSVYLICRKRKNEIINSLLNNEIVVSSYLKKNLSSVSDITKITYLPHRFDIIIKGNEAYFYLKEDK